MLLEGPGGRDCRDRYNFAGGYLTEKRRTRTRTRTVAIGRPGSSLHRSTDNEDWCPGRYNGYVEYRQPDRDPTIPFEQLGRFFFTVGDRGGSAE